MTGTSVKHSKGKSVPRYSSYEYPSQNANNQTVQNHEEVHGQNRVGTRIIHVPDL